MRWVIVIFLFLLYIINYADKAIVGYSAIPIMKDLNLNFSEWGLVGSSFYWLFSIAGILGAALSDKIGTRKMLTIMAIVWTICQFGAFAIFSLPMLIFSRVLLGAFEGPFLATATSHVSRWFPPERRAFAMSLVNCGSMGAKNDGSLAHCPYFQLQLADWFRFSRSPQSYMACFLAYIRSRKT